MRILLIAASLVFVAVSAHADAASPSMGQPLVSAGGERLSEAMGHYSRARSLLIAALHEYDKGLKKVNPDALMDVEAFRGNILQRAQELERVLDPQPRASRGGVRYDADSRLLGEAGKQ